MALMILTDLPHCTVWAHLSTSESRGWSGKNTSEYERVKTNLSRITGALQSIPSARDSLRRKFKEKGWLTPTGNPTEEELVTHALGRIELDPNQCGKFVAMLSDIEGMDLIVNRLNGMIVHVFLCLLYCMGERLRREELGNESGKTLSVCEKDVAQEEGNYQHHAD